MIDYSPFWNTIKEKRVTTYALITKHGISSATIDRLRKGKGLSTTKLDDLCRILDCEIYDLIKYKKDEPQ